MSKSKVQAEATDSRRDTLIGLTVLEQLRNLDNSLKTLTRQWVDKGMHTYQPEYKEATRRLKEVWCDEALKVLDAVTPTNKPKGK